MATPTMCRVGSLKNQKKKKKYSTAATWLRNRVDQVERQAAARRSSGPFNRETRRCCLTPRKNFNQT